MQHKCKLMEPPSTHFGCCEFRALMPRRVTGWRDEGGARFNGALINMKPTMASGHGFRFLQLAVGRILRGKFAVGRGVRHRWLPSGPVVITIWHALGKEGRQTQRFGRRTLSSAIQQQETSSRWRGHRRWWWCLDGANAEFRLQGSCTTRPKTTQQRRIWPWLDCVTGSPAEEARDEVRIGVVDVVVQSGSTTTAAAVTATVGRGLRLSTQDKSRRLEGLARRDLPSLRSVRWSLPSEIHEIHTASVHTSRFSLPRSRKVQGRKRHQEERTHPMLARNKHTPCRLPQVGKAPRGKPPWQTLPPPEQRQSQTRSAPNGQPCGRVSLKVMAGARLKKRSLLRTSSHSAQAPEALDLTLPQSRIKSNAGHLVWVRIQSVSLLLFKILSSFWSCYVAGSQVNSVPISCGRTPLRGLVELHANG